MTETTENSTGVRAWFRSLDEPARQRVRAADYYVREKVPADVAASLMRYGTSWYLTAWGGQHSDGFHIHSADAEALEDFDADRSWCRVPGCDRPTDHLEPGSTHDGARVWEVDAFTDAAGNDMVTSAQARLTMSAWPLCHMHTSADVDPHDAAGRPA